MLPENTVLSHIVQRYARLLDRFGQELSKPPLVLPNGDFFPDRFTNNRRSLVQLIRRMQKHARIDDIPVRAVLIEEEPSPTATGSSCASGACTMPQTEEPVVARIQDLGEGWQFNVPAVELGVPEVLTTHLARSLGYVFLQETKRSDTDIDEPLEVSAELSAAMLGFGVLLLQGAYIYKKSCGGPSVRRFTALSCAELAVATALFSELAGHAAKPALRELDPTQREAMTEALEWARSNPRLLETLKTEPARVAAGDFALEDSKPWLYRTLKLGGKKRTSEAPLVEGAELEQLEAMLSASPLSPRTRQNAQPDPERDELRSLVDEALGSRASAE
jgi:hypothetical protein